MEKELKDLLESLGEPKEAKKETKETSEKKPSFDSLLQEFKKWQNENNDNRIVFITVAEKDVEDTDHDNWQSGMLVCGTGEHLFKNLSASWAKSGNLKELITDAAKVANSVPEGLLEKTEDGDIPEPLKALMALKKMLS